MGVGGKYEPSFNPLAPLLLSLAKAAATDAQQRQHSWSACKRKSDIAREGRGGAGVGRPLPPALGAPLGGTCLGHAHQSRQAPRRARTRSREGIREQEGALHGQVWTRRLRVARRGRRSARAARILSAARSSAPQVRLQVRAATVHIAAGARWDLPSSGRLRALPSPGAGLPSCSLRHPRGYGGLRGPGLERKRLGDCWCLPARLCVCLCRCERLRRRGRQRQLAPPARRSRAPASPPRGDWRPAAPGLVRAPGLVQGRGIPGSSSEGGGEGGGEAGWE